jgi:hypothetical protein
MAPPSFVSFRSLRPYSPGCAAFPAKKSRDPPFDRLRAYPERCEGTGLTTVGSEMAQEFARQRPSVPPLDSRLSLHLFPLSFRLAFLRLLAYSYAEKHPG